MGVSLGDLHFTLGIDESQIDKQLADAKKKITAALTDPALTSANLAAGLKSAKIDATRALETERLAKANLSNAKATDIAARSQVTLNNLNLTGIGIANRNAAAQQTAGNAATISNNAALASAQRLISAQNQATASHSRMTTAANAAAISQQRLANHSNVTSRAFLTQNGIALRLGSTLGSAFTVVSIYAFVKKLAEVRGEFELQQVSLRAITRDVQAADKIFSQVKTLSVKSPFTFSELLRDTKQLSAFSIETDKLFGALTRLADVSAGLGVDMNRIILAYGQVKAATVLRGQELRQFTEAGIPIIDMLAQSFTKLENKVVSAGDVFGMISKKMVSFKDVDAIFTQLTSSGGMFFEMQKKQSETLAGKLANLKDAYMIMLNAIGEGNDSSLKGGADFLYTLMNNWKDVADVLKVVIAAYGSYKAISIAIGVVEKTNLLIKAEAIALLRANAAANITMSRSQLMVAASSNVLTGSFTKLGTAMKANWIALTIAGLTAIGVAIYNTYQNAHELENSLTKITSEENASAQAQIMHVGILTDKIKDMVVHSQNRNDIIKELNNVAGPYLSNLIQEGDSYEIIMEKLKGVNAAIWENAKAKAYQNANTKVQDTLTKDISNAQDALEKALSNIGVSGELGSGLASKMLGDIQKNPKLAQSISSLTKYINDEINKATGSSSNLGAVSPGMAGYAGKEEVAFGSLTETLKGFSKEAVNANSEMDKATARMSGWGSASAPIPIQITAITDALEAEIQKIKSKRAVDDNDIEVRNLKVKALLAEGEAYRSLGQIKDAVKVEGQAKDLDPTIDSLGRLKKAVEELSSFKASGIRIETLFPDGQDTEKASENIIKEVKKTEDEYNSLANAKKGIYTDKEISDAKKVAAAYRDIATQILGWTEKIKPEREDQITRNARMRAEAMKKLNDQYLKDQEEFNNYDLGIEAKRIANMENSIAKELKINELSFAKKEADIVRLRRIRLDELNAAAGIKRGAANEITDYSQTTSVISKLSEKQLPTSERAAVQAASDQALADEKQARINNEKSKAEAVIAINRDWALKISDIWRDVDAIFLSGTEKERAAINKKYDDWARQAKLAGSYNKDTIATGTPASDILPAVDKKRTDNEQKAADLSVLIERRRNEDMIQLNNKLASDRLTIGEEVERNLNAIRLSGWGDNEKLMQADFKTSQSYAAKKIALLKAQTLAENPQRNEQVTAAESAKDLAAKNEELRKQKKLYSDVVGAAKDIQNIFADFGVELGGNVNKYLEGVGKILDGVSSMDVTKPFTLVTGGIKVLSGMADQVSAIFGDSAHKLSQATIDYYDDLMSTMNDVISVHKKLMDELSGSAAVSESAKTIELIKKQIQATRQLGLEYLASNAAHSHTYGHQLALSLDEYRAQLKPIGVDLSDVAGGIGQLFTMTPKQLEQIKEEVPAAWAKIDDQTRAYLQTIIDSGTALDDTTAALGEALTNLSYDSAKSELQDLISDTDKTMADISTNFEKYMRDAIINSIMKGDVQTLIQKWYTDFTAAMSDGALTEQEKASLQAEYEAIGQEAINKRDTALAAAGLSTTSDVAKKGLQGEIKGVTEDTAQLLASLLNAVRGDVSLQNISLKSIEGILSNTGSVTANSLAQLQQIQSNTYNLMMDFRSIMGGKGTIGTGIRVTMMN